MIKPPYTLPDFTIVQGGPLFQMLRYVHLTDDALSLLHKRIVVISLAAWLPLFVLSALEGHLLDETVAMPFALDWDVHTRFLLVVPLLITAELLVHERMRPVAQSFHERALIPESAMKRFQNALGSAYRLRNSVTAELCLLAFVYLIGVFVIWPHYGAIVTSTWYATSTPAGMRMTYAGMWLGYVSIPTFQFLLLRWYFRLGIWSCFLWHVSRIELSLIPTHPDRVAGLGFLSDTAYAFAALAVAHGALLAGALANRIFYLHATLLDFKLEIAAIVVFVLCVALGPLMLFMPQLAEAKRSGLRSYGTLAEDYVRDFDSKWLRGSSTGDKGLLGSADIQSLADMADSYDVVRQMSVVPFTRQDVVRLLAATLVPLAPLTLTMMPIGELFKVMMGILF